MVENKNKEQIEGTKDEENSVKSKKTKNKNLVLRAKLTSIFVGLLWTVIIFIEYDIFSYSWHRDD